MDIVVEELSRYSLVTTASEDDVRKEQISKHASLLEEKSLQEKTFSVEKQTKVVRYMNTYRLESRRPWNVESVQAVLKEVLTRDLAEARYEPTTMTRTGVSLAGEIRNRVKQLNFDRYKIVCLVQIVEKHQQSILSTAKFLWDADRDRYAVFSLNNAHIAATACVFGVYYD